jgi:phosphoserine phosphatase
MGEISLSQTSVQELAPEASRPPLCVDLDGTLVKSDTLMDSLLVLARTRPLALLQFPAWLLRGKAAVKAEVGARVALDVRHLPYNRALIEFLEAERGEGRKVYLATGADQTLARRIADHLGLFDGVLASDGTTNLTGGNKLEGLRQQFGEAGYDYVGNAGPDVPLLQHAKTAMLANPTRLRGSPVAFAGASEGDSAAPVGEEHFDFCAAAAGAHADGAVGDSGGDCVYQLQPVRVSDVHRERSAGY